MEKPAAIYRLYATDANDATVILETKIKRHYRERFKTMFQSAFIDMARMDRPPVYYRALFQALATLDPVQYRSLTARELATDTGMSLNSAQRAIAMLVADRVLYRKGAGAGVRYRINNNVAWASTAEKHNLAVMDQEVIDARGRG